MKGLRVWKRRGKARWADGHSLPTRLLRCSQPISVGATWTLRMAGPWPYLTLSSYCSWDDWSWHKVVLFRCHPPCMQLESYVSYTIEGSLFHHLYMCQSQCSFHVGYKWSYWMWAWHMVSFEGDRFIIVRLNIMTSMVFANVAPKGGSHTIKTQDVC